MTAYLLTYGQLLRTKLAMTADHLQARLDSVLRAEDIPADQPKKDGFPVWAIVLIVLGVLLCAIPFCVIIILTLLGPSIGNVFSDIILDI